MVRYSIAINKLMFLPASANGMNALKYKYLNASNTIPNLIGDSYLGNYGIYDMTSYDMLGERTLSASLSLLSQS